MLLLYMCWASDFKICEKNPLGLSCLLDFCYFSTHVWQFSVYSSRFYPDVHCLTHTTHLYLSHWTWYHTSIASNNVIFCMSCYYHSHLIISYLAQILGFWKKHVLLCKIYSPFSFLLYETGEKKLQICSSSWRNTSGKLSVPLLVPGVFSRTRTA